MSLTKNNTYSIHNELLKLIYSKCSACIRFSGLSGIVHNKDTISAVKYMSMVTRVKSERNEKLVIITQ